MGGLIRRSDEIHGREDYAGEPRQRRPRLPEGMPASEVEALSARNAARTGSDQLFTKTSVSFSFYTLRAMEAVGFDFYDEHFDEFWTPWREQAAQNLLTWAEDSVNVRSDCHAWGSLSLHEFVTEVAGLRPGAPGWAKMVFQPRLRLFPTLDITIPVNNAKGDQVIMVQVKWERVNNDNTLVKVKKLSCEVDTEDGLPVVVRLPDREEFTVDLRDELEYRLEALGL